MPLCPEDFNVFDLGIWRPARSGPGGDQVGDAAKVISGLSAYYQPASRELVVPGQRQRFIEAELWILGLDEAGERLDVRAGDLLDYKDPLTGETIERIEVLQVQTWMDEGALDHVKLRAGRR